MLIASSWQMLLHATRVIRRNNLDMRMHIRRFTRYANPISN
jgi:hypothetical protein